MRDERDEKLDQLFASARSWQPDTSSLEMHFETRLMARINERAAQPNPWQRLVWRMMPAFAACAGICLVFNLAVIQPDNDDMLVSINTIQDDGD